MCFVRVVAVAVSVSVVVVLVFVMLIDRPLYLDAEAPVDDRVANLLSLMTVEEKVAQMLNPVGQVDGPGNFNVNYSYVLANYGSTGLGTLYSGIGGCPAGTGSGLDCLNLLQASMVNASRLHIPVSIIGETLVGGCGGCTIFPQPVLRGGTFNLALEAAVGASIARQARAHGVDRGLSPVLQVDTDARFGRFEESYGEDPFLVSSFGVAVARALQGGAEGPRAYLPDPATSLCLEAKHYFAYGHGGRDWYRADITDRTVYDVYVKPWRAFVRDAGGRGVMVAHPEVNGLPLHGSRWALTDTLRTFLGGVNGTEWGGLIASDWGNVGGVVDHGIAKDKEHAAMQAAWSGLDNEMCPPPSPTATLVASAKAGLIAMKYIDRAAGNNLREKFAARLFDTVNGAPGWFVNTTAAAAVADTPGDRALAYAVASEGVALLKNDVRAATGARVLPLALRAGTRVALLGPAAGCVAGERAPCLAETAMGGHYTSYGARIVTLVEAAGNASGVASVAHVVGANIDDDDESGVPAAVAAATAADVVIVAVGDSIPISTGSCSEMSDTDDTNLPGGQLALLDAVAAARGGDVVVVLFTCRPVTFGAGPQSRFGPNNALLDRLPAVVAGWRPGEEAGNAVWDILTGAVNPSGRLTQNWVRHVGAVKGPASPYLQARGALVKNYFSGDPATALFPFAWGMAYTNYTVTGAALTPGGDGAVVDADATLTVTGRIASAGPAGKVSLLLYYSQNAPTKWARFGTQLFAFGKFDVPADSAGTPFSFSARVRDMDAYEPATGDYEVFTGAYSVTLGTCATCPALAQWTVNVNGTYTWIWDYTV